ncbi:hypothetical protein I302_106129 [Kwoniella bestiolae CBS 10118]|uniref:Zinc-finger domain-containing protein n=1 Tax=Kwoniella bestiolae CBS 10118 TaxID=1296100 RepID=A0A1B9G326_9TREE|nr:hypothetical protein I302_05253 [Kwoniella bestiolae CBS 10118]OCF25433.1 hypothetical protein I302_05253 [Kwoniella bestiolae CBS 10118]
MVVSPLKRSSDIPRSESSTSDLSTISSEKEAEKEAAQEEVKVINGKGKKRARESDGSVDRAAKKKARQSEGGVSVDGKKEKGTYCHICRRKCEADRYLKCNNAKKKGKPNRPCHLSYCDRDLTVRYGLSPEKIGSIRKKKNHSSSSIDGPDGEGYEWECPCCRDDCQASGCRKKKGLEPLGNLAKAARASNASSIHATPLQNGQSTSKSTPSKPTTATPTKKVESDDESALSEIEVDHSKKKAARPSKVNGTTSVEKGNRKRNSISASDSTDLTDLDAENFTELQKKKGRTSKVNGEGKSVSGTPKDKKGKAKSTVSTPKQKDGKAKEKSGSKAKNTPVVEIKKGKSKENGKATPKKDGKAQKATPKKKVKDEKDKEKKVKPKPVKKPEVIPEPPIFEKVATRLGREEAEQRIMLREYLFRFRNVLSFPERALFPVDDFDRPLTEASVRLFAGAMVDMIKDEMQGSEDEDLVDTLFNIREELRYYADLARFQSMYNMLSEPLNLKLPPPIVDERLEANNSALRAILDLGEDQATPAWATELTAGPSRRTAASRIPPPAEVVRMLLAFAERTLSSPKIRADMEYFVPENEIRRKHASAIKKETSMMETRKKKLNEARLKCKTAAETKAHKEQYNKEMRDFTMRLDLINVNLEAQLARRALRHEPLGIDLDGRIYYALAPREIDDDVRPPLGWASGLLVWGIGVDGNTGGDSGLPTSVERWSHFGQSKDVKQLVQWIEWRFQKHIESLKPAKKSTANPKTPIKNPFTTPSKSNATAKKTPGSKMKQKTLLEVVIPTSNKRSFPSIGSAESSLSSLSTAAKALGDDASSTSSGLTPPPAASLDELLALVNPEGYQPSLETIEEQGNRLVTNLRQVHRWLEVLEWKGFGEVA